MTIAELETKRDAKKVEAQAIHALAEKANRDFTEDESKTFDGLMDEADTVQERITATVKREKRLASLKIKSVETLGRETEPNPLGTTDVKVGKDRIEDDPLKGFKTPRVFLSAVMDAGQGGKLAEGLNFLKAPRDRTGTAMAAAGSDEHSTFSDQRGGFFVPEGFSPEFLRVEPEDDPTAAATRKIPMATSVVKINARVDKNHTSSVSGGLVVGRSAESVAKTSSRIAVEQLALTAHSLFGFAYATEELLTDSAVSFIAIIDAGFRDEFNSHILNERINGTGVSQFLGVMNSAALQSVPKVTSPAQAANTILFDNVVQMRSQCWRYGNAMWLANHDTLPQLMKMNVEVGVAGAPVWQPSAREDHPDLLLGRPIIFSEYLQTLGTKGDIILVNWSEYLEGMLQPLKSAESIHVRFLEHERAFKFWLRNAGMPWWSAALTPKKSSTKLSPYISLDTRA